MDLKNIIESILFVAARPVDIAELEKCTGQPRADIIAAVEALQADRKNSGIIILSQHGGYLMSTHPESTEPVKNFLNAELREKLTEAAIETLAIVAYKQPVTRAEIESIRGVNSQYTLRLLLMRGLVERTANSKDARVNLYRTTHEFLQHLGLSDAKDLPDFEELTAKIKPPENFAVH